MRYFEKKSLIIPTPDFGWGFGPEITQHIKNKVTKSLLKDVANSKTNTYSFEIKNDFRRQLGKYLEPEKQREVIKTTMKKLGKDIVENLKDFYKISSIQLNLHQKLVAQKIKNPDTKGLLMYWNVGSGKTIGAIAAANALKAKATVVVPASLQDNFSHNINLYKSNPANFDIKSYNNFVKNPDTKNKKLLIVDEAQNLSNAQSLRTKKILEARKGFSKTLLLSGTPIKNRPSELAPIIDTITGEETLPLDPAKFDNEYIKVTRHTPSLWNRIIHGQKPQDDISINHLQDLKDKLHGLVDYYDPVNPKDYPSVSEHVVGVPMNKDQVNLYNYYERKLPKVVRYKLEHSITPSKKDVAKLNSFLSATRQISNTEDPFLKGNGDVSPKVKKIVDFISKDKRPSVVYSNYLASGLDPIAYQLKQREIPYGIYTGALSSKQKSALVKAYNTKKIKTLLISSSGGEGLDLKDTGSMHILEPHWNDPKINQVIGRGVRFKSHSNLPSDERHVDVYRYISDFPNPSPGLLQRMHLMKPKKNTRVSADQYLYNLSNTKQLINNMFLNVLKTEGTSK